MLLLSLLCAAAFCLEPQDPVRVTATLTQSRVVVGETTTLQITVETRGSAPEEMRVPPLSPELQVIGTSDFTQTQITVPGGRSRATRREITLLARSPGIYRIPPVTVVVGGAVYRTQPLDVIVRSGPGSPDATPTSTSSTLRVWLRPDTVFVGQQVLLYAEVTFSEDVRARQSRPATFDPPAPTGFWIQDVPDPISIALRVREGRTVETQTYRRAYFPLNAGEFRFPPARLHYEVRRGFLYAPDSRELVSDSAQLIVLPLPSQDRPASFNGAVGRLALRVAVQPAQVRAGEALLLTVELEGIGNVKTLPAPRVPELPNAEVFPPSQESRVEVADDQVGGAKRFRWVIVPYEDGVLTIPPIEYSVFDPELRSYVTLQSDAHNVIVAPASAVVAAEELVNTLRRAPAHDPLRWARSPAFLALQAMPLLLFLGVAHARRRRAQPPGPRQEAARLRCAVAELRARSSAPTFLSELEQLVREAAHCIAGASRTEPAAWLRTHGQAVAAHRMELLIRELRHLRYAPHATFDAEQLIRRTLELIALLTPRRSWRTRRASLIALGCTLTLAPATHAQLDAFEHGVSLYDSGQFREAARSFHEYARAHAADANAWFNLGLASYSAGERGRAAWAWLRAARLAPRDESIQQNLRAMGAASAAQRVLPPDRLTVSERTLLAAAGWWLVLGALIAALRHRRYRWAALPGIILLFITGTISLAVVLRAPLVTPLREGTALYAAPTTREESLATLEIGAVAVLVERADRWLRVRTADGAEGWVERAAVAAP